LAKGRISTGAKVPRELSQSEKSFRNIHGVPV